MRSAFAAVAAFVFCFILSTPGFAEPRIKALLSQGKIKPAETVLFSIQAEWPKHEAQYQFAVPNLPLENLSVVEQGQSQETYPGEGGEWTRKIFSFKLKPAKPGTAGVLEFNLPYIDPQLQKGGTFKVEPLKLSVRKSGSLKWFFIPAAGILLCAGFVPFVLAKRKKSKSLAPVSPARQAAEQFRQLLERQPEFDTTLLPQLNQHLRSFLTETYQIPGPYHTENELADGLETAGVPKEELGMIKNILKEIEEIRYLGNPTEAEYRRLRNDLLRFIHSKQTVVISTTEGRRNPVF